MLSFEDLNYIYIMFEIFIAMNFDDQL